MVFFSKYTKIQEIKDIKVKKETIIGTWNPCCLTKWLKNCLLLINKTHVQVTKVLDTEMAEGNVAVK